MHLPGVFELGINPGTPDGPLLVKITVQRYTTDEGPPVHHPISPSLEDFEGQINSLQDELDEIRERARRAFQAVP
jgi:hypothetical protein